MANEKGSVHQYLLECLNSHQLRFKADRNNYQWTYESCLLIQHLWMLSLTVKCKEPIKTYRVQQLYLLCGINKKNDPVCPDEPYHQDKEDRKKALLYLYNVLLTTLINLVR